MRIVCVLFLSGLLLLAGCAGHHVRHLPRHYWQDSSVQTIPMRSLSFQYKVLPLKDEVGIVASAYPERIPQWATWYEEISLYIYLADENGQVLAMQEVALMPRPLDKQTGLPVEASLSLGTKRDQPLFVAFGYRLVLTDATPDTAPSRRLLVAEGALEQ